MASRWVQALLFLVMGTLLLHLAIGPFERQTVVTCQFGPPSSSAVIRLPSTSAAFGRIRVEGSLSGDFKRKLYHYDGRAVWMMNGQQAEGKVAGPIFLAGDGSVEAFSLWIAHPAFGQDELTLATLNGNGRLDANASKAFLFVDPSEKLSNPVGYVCRSDRNFGHIYNRLASLNWLVAIAVLAIAWVVMFLANRKANGMDFGHR